MLIIGHKNMEQALKWHILRFKEALLKNPQTRIPQLTMINDINVKFQQFFKMSKNQKKLKI